MTRRALLIRVMIFGPLFAYFGYGAYQKWKSERADAQEQAAAASAREVELKAATKSVRLNDGRSIDIVELTPEQAERLHGIKVPTGAEVKPSAGAADARPDAPPEGAAKPVTPEAADPAN